MSRSKKKRSRGKNRRRQQLRTKSERMTSRQEGGYTEEEVSLSQLFKKHIVEVLLVILAVIGVIFLILLGPDKKAVERLQESFDSQLYGQSLEWNEIFSQGYKVFVLTDQDIIQTSFDTLPEDFKINWKKMSVTRIQANQIGSTIEKIKIVINGLNFVSANVSDLKATAILSRGKGSSARLARFGKLEFVAKIVEDDGSQLFCLLGLRDL